MPNRYLTPVSALLKDGTPFTEVEDYIDKLPLSEDAKSALWLFAWAETPSEDRRAETRELLSLISG